MASIGRTLKRTVHRQALRNTAKRIRIDSILSGALDRAFVELDDCAESDSEEGGAVVSENCNAECESDEGGAGVSEGYNSECGEGLQEGPIDQTLQDSDSVDADGADSLPENVPCNFEHDSESGSDRDCDVASNASSDDGPPVFESDAAKEQYAIDTIRGWAQEPGVLSMSKLDDLLHRLSLIFPRMPLTYTTLFQCNYRFDINELPSGGSLWFKGIRANLDQLQNLKEYLQKFQKIILDVGIDGLPLVRAKLWPILAHLVGTDNQPFIVAVFRGTKDPSNVDEFLKKYVDELKELLQTGYSFDGKVYEVQIRRYILDAPARSFIKCCVRYNAKAGCERCVVTGEWHCNRMTFGNLDQPLRTDETFRQREQPQHHSGDSPLEELGTGMVSQFALDPMHLVYAGVFKRLLEYWLKILGNWKLHQEVIDIISTVFEFLRPYCPLDFNRKPRSLSFFSKLKCTELRRMLLYDGILVFKDLVDVNIYKHFLLLHCSIYILSSRSLIAVHRESARKFIRLFIEHSVRIYGLAFVVYNVHSLLHLVDDCDVDTILEELSAFKFENKLKSIKETLKSGLHQLQQLARRDQEKPSKVILSSRASHVVLSFKVRGARTGGAGKHFKRLKAGSLLLKIGKSDSCFRTKSGDVIVLKDIVLREKKVYLIGCKFLVCEDFYEYPLPSSELGIVRVSELGIRKAYRLKDVDNKCYLMPDGDHFLCVPILHSSESL